MEKEKICCPRFNPKLWDNKLIVWENKKFVVGKVKTFMFMPLNFGKVISSLQSKIDMSGSKMVDYLCLSDHNSKGNMKILLAVDKEVKDSENITLSGKFYSKVYEGDFKETGKWCKDYEGHIAKLNYKVKKWYMWYTTCPKCAKKYGKNYVVIICEIEALK